MKTRLTWPELPDHVRAAVEGMLGSPVVSAVSQPGGFSPGTTDRVVTFQRAQAEALPPWLRARWQG